MANDGLVPGAVSHLYYLEGFGEGADLVELDENGVGYAFGDAPSETLGVCNEEVIPHQLDPIAEALGEGSPAFPVVFVQRGPLNGDEGMVAPTLPRGLSCLGGEGSHRWT